MPLQDYFNTSYLHHILKHFTKTIDPTIEPELRSAFHKTIEDFAQICEATPPSPKAPVAGYILGQLRDMQAMESSGDHVPAINSRPVERHQRLMLKVLGDMQRNCLVNGAWSRRVTVTMVLIYS